EVRAVLAEVDDLGVLPERQAPRRRREIAHDRAEQRRLSRAVPPDDREALARHEAQREILDEAPVAPLGGEVARLEHGLSAAGRARLEHRAELLRRRRRRLGRLGAADARLLLAGAGLGLPPQPLELLAQEVLPVRLGALLEHLALGLGLEV